MRMNEILKLFNVQQRRFLMKLIINRNMKY